MEALCCWSPRLANRSRYEYMRQLVHCLELDKESHIEKVLRPNVDGVVHDWAWSETNTQLIANGTRVDSRADEWLLFPWIESLWMAASAFDSG